MMIYSWLEWGNYLKGWLCMSHNWGKTSLTVWTSLFHVFLWNNFGIFNRVNKKVWRQFQTRFQGERHLSRLLSLAIYFNEMALREDGLKNKVRFVVWPSVTQEAALLRGRGCGKGNCKECQSHIRVTEKQPATDDHTNGGAQKQWGWKSQLLQNVCLSITLFIYIRVRVSIQLQCVCTCMWSLWTCI